MAENQFGKEKTARHDGHKPGDMKHYQHKNGGRGKVYYRALAAGTAVGLAGDNVAAQIVDFFNPISDVKDVVDLVIEFNGGANPNASSTEDSSPQQP
jgi:hypothetical protein